MPNRYLKHKWQKVTLVVAAVVLGLVFVLGFFFNEHWSPILEKKLSEAILKSTDSLYHVDFASAEFHLFEGRVVIRDINVTHDEAVFNRLRAAGLAPNNVLDAHIKRLVITSIHPFKLYFNHVIDFGQIILSAPEVHLRYQLNHDKDTSTHKDDRTAWQKIAKTFHSVHVNDIFLNDVKFRYADYTGNKLEISDLKEMNLHANDLLIDSTTQRDTSRFLFCKDIITELNDYVGHTHNNLYTYKVKYLKLSTLSSQLNVEHFELIPDKSFFKKTMGDRYALQVDSIQLTHFDFLTYHKYRKFSASHLTIDRASLALMANPNRKPGNRDKTKSFPNIALKNLPLDCRLDSVSVTGLNFAYTEYNPKSNQTGTINFNRSHVCILNITNNAEALNKNHWTSVRVSTLLMNKAEVNVVCNFDMTDPQAAFNYRGTVGPMNLRALNPALIPLGMAKINDGQLKECSFDMHANLKEETGKVQVLYNNLKVSVLKPDSDKTMLKKQILSSLYANIFILKHDNPDEPGDAPRSFAVRFARTPDIPFFKFNWQSLLTGIKTCAGYGQKTQDATKAMVAQNAINKQDRKDRRAARKARRAERKAEKAQKKLEKELEASEGNN